MNKGFRLRRFQRRSKKQIAPVILACIYLSLAPFASACAGPQRFASRATGAQPQPGLPTVSNPQGEVGDLVRFPSPEVEFIVGPQLKSGSPLNPVPWFDQNAFEKGLQHGVDFPSTSPMHLVNGTVSVAKDSKTIVGANTKFRQDFAGVAPYTYNVIVVDSSGITRSYVLTEVVDDTHLLVSVAWQQSSASGLHISKASADEYDNYINLNYYDQALCQYVNYYRTGDARFLSYARKIADSWWNAPGIAGGHAEIENSLSPRNVSLNGLILRALDGRPEMWPWITLFVREQFQTWVGLRLKYDGFYYGVRDPGYMLLFAANLARVHSDPAVRAEFRQKVLDAAVNYYGRLQSPDGGFYFDLDVVEHTTQPFQVGLLAEGLIAVHRLTGDERVKRTILKSAEHQFNRCYNPRGWRGMYYFVGGKNKDTKESCDAGCGAASNSYPPSDTGIISEVRQLNGTAIHEFGYAYLISGDVKFKTWGDELLEATFGGRDGYRGLAAARAKEYNESYRSSGKYLAWRLSHGTSSAISEIAVPESIPAATVVTAVSGSANELIPAALKEALSLASTAALPSESRLQELVEQIDAAGKAVDRAPNTFLNAAALLNELKAAGEHMRSALLIVTTNKGSGDDARVRIGWAAARLKRAVDRMQSRPAP